MKLAIFPLPLVLYPGGKTKLRIFEQRYLRMVRESAGQSGFVLTTHQNRAVHHTSSVGSRVQIVDFQTLDDGMLGIDIEASQAVTISDIEVEHDNLCKASITELNHWPDAGHNDITSQLSDRLAKLFSDNEELGQLYTEPKLDNAAWVCARWLELLPILPGQKLMFFRSESYLQAVSLLNNILISKDL